MKKFLAIISSLMIVEAPAVSVISCSSNKETNNEFGRQNEITNSAYSEYNSLKSISKSKFKNNFYDFYKINKENNEKNNFYLNQIKDNVDDMINGIFVLNDDWEMEPSSKKYDFKDGINWNVKSDNGDVEMTYMFSRMSFVRKMLKVYIYTGEIKYLNKAIYYVKDFQKKQPLNIETMSKNGGTWRTIDTAIRMDTLLLLSEILQKQNMDYEWINDYILLHYSFLNGLLWQMTRNI